MARIIKGRQMTARYYKGREVLKEYKQGRLVYEKQTSIPDYLCFTALEAGQFTLTIPAAVTATYLSYVEWSKDGRTWNHTDNTSEAVTIDVQVAQGDKVYWRGEGIKYGTYAQPSTTANSTFSSTANFNASGNIMSLLFGENFVGVTALSSSSTYAFAGLFANNKKLKSIEELSMPATTLANACYASTFSSCSSLTGMMRELPATTIPQSAYYMLFRICPSITSTPSMTINEVGGGYQMLYAFERCTSLTDASNIIINAVGESSCASSFSGCTSLTSTPILAVERLAKGCFNIMFQNCTNLKYVKCLATDISATNCLQNWLSGVSSTGTFIQAEGVEWPRGSSGIPTGWVDVEKRTMPSGYKQLLQVTSNGTAYIQLSFGFEETDEVAATFSVDTSQRTDKYIVCPKTWNNNSNRYGMGVHNSGHYTAAFGNLSTSNTTLTPRTSNNGELHNWTYAAATFAVTDKSCSINITGYTFGGITTNLRLFYGYNSNTKGAISSYKHIKGSTTACDFVAAIRESDDTAGLYDLANDEFMTCNGLTAGEEI